MSGQSVASQTDAELFAIARGIIQGRLMIVDLEDPDWQVSMALILSAWAKEDVPPNIGLMMVPLGPHEHSYWLNGRVPGCTFKVEMVAAEDMDRLREFYRPMHEALYPEDTDA